MLYVIDEESNNKIAFPIRSSELMANAALVASNGPEFGFGFGSVQARV